MGRIIVICVLAVMLVSIAGCSLFAKPPQTSIEKDLSDILSTQDAPASDTTDNADADAIVKTYNEGDLVSFPKLKAEDPDGNVVSIKFKQPLNENGEWQTEHGDAGTYDTQVSVSDGSLTVVKNIRIIILKSNQAPSIIMPEELIVDEGDTVELNPIVSDADDDNVAVTYDGWMTSKSKETSYDDAGTYMVKITANDGLHNSTADVKIVVNNANRAPVFVPGSFD